MFEGLFGNGSNSAVSALGLPPELVQQLNMDQAGNIGALLLAAGQPGQYGDRAKILAQLPEVLNGSQRQLLQYAQLVREAKQQELANKRADAQLSMQKEEWDLKKQEAARKLALQQKAQELYGSLFNTDGSSASTGSTTPTVPAVPDSMKTIPGSVAPSPTDPSLGGQVPAQASASPSVGSADQGKINVRGVMVTPGQLNTLKLMAARGDYDAVDKELLRIAGEEKFTTTKDENGNYISTSNNGRVYTQTTNQPGNKIIEEIGTKGGAALIDGRQKAVAARDMVTQSNDALQLLDQGIYSGPMGGAKLDMARWGSWLQEKAGIDPGSLKDDVARTQAFKAATGRMAINIAKQLGSGAGITDADREFALGIAGADINNLDEASVRKVLELGRKYGVETVNSYNQTADAVRGAVSPEQYKLIAPYTSRVQLPELYRSKPRDAAAKPGQQGTPGAIVTKTVGGKTYANDGTGWFEVK